MGTYVYGVSSKKRKIKGFDEPVFELIFVDKPNFSMFADEFSRQGAATIGKLNAKGSMRGSLVAYDLSNKDVLAFVVYRYIAYDNVFYDTAEDRALEWAGYVKWVGNRLVKISTVEYEELMNEQRKRDAWTEFASA